MNRTRWLVVLSVMFSSITALGLPFAAMLVLGPGDYGIFSIFYLIGAAANISQLAVVGEAWSRARDSDGPNAWKPYINATIAVALIGATCAVVVALCIEEFRTLALASFFAIFAQVYRNGSRFRAFRNLDWRYVLPGDSLGMLATLCVVTYLLVHSEVTVELVVFCWAITRVAGLLGSRPPGRLSPRAAVAWIRSHKHEIAVLGTDAAMGDLATIGVQYLLTPIIGLAGLGTFRAVSNVGGPVRTVVFPLRPILMRLSPQALGSSTFTFRVMGVASLLGLSTFGVLWWLSTTQIELGTLNNLFPLAGLVGVYVLAMVGDAVYSLIARQMASSGSLLVTRACVSAVAIAGPLVGALVGATVGAIAGYVLYICFASIMWWFIVRKHSRSLT